jgi:hypothetical protein
LYRWAYSANEKKQITKKHFIHRDRVFFLYKNLSFSQAVFMKIKVYETEGRTRDERENRVPIFPKDGERVQNDG